MLDTLILTILIFAAAMLYSAVGHGGASGYLAAMALVGLPPGIMRPAALVLNILVAGIGTVRFASSRQPEIARQGSAVVGSRGPGKAVEPQAASRKPQAPSPKPTSPPHPLTPCCEGGTGVPPVHRPDACAPHPFPFRLFIPLTAASIPAAWFGGLTRLPDPIYQQIVGAALLLAAVRFFITPTRAARGPMAIPLALFLGGGIGLMSGLTGVGGGIFLSPILLMGRWADARTTAALSAPFILLNSMAGLSGQIMTGVRIPTEMIGPWAIAAILGGLIGSTLGARHLGGRTLQRLLATVLVIAGVKMLLG